MSNAAIKVGLLLAVTFFISVSPVHALSKEHLALTDDPFHNQAVVPVTAPEEKQKDTAKKTEPEVKPTESTAETESLKPVEHIVALGDTLTSVAEKNATTWERLFAKNTQIVSPDIVAVGEKLIVPLPDEQLPERPLPQPVTSSAPAVSGGSSSAVGFVRGSVMGNTYAPGYCTWYAKNRRPDLPNRMGNASSWVASAAAQGFATGSSPRVGAIGQQGNHVVYVESVNADGTVTVSEMNYSGLYQISSRTVPASYFTYIY